MTSKDGMIHLVATCSPTRNFRTSCIGMGRVGDYAVRVKLLARAHKHIYARTYVGTYVHTYINAHYTFRIYSLIGANKQYIAAV